MDNYLIYRAICEKILSLDKEVTQLSNIDNQTLSDIVFEGNLGAVSKDDFIIILQILSDFNSLINQNKELLRKAAT